MCRRMWSASSASPRLPTRDRATRSAWRSRHSSPGPPVPAARRATVAPRSPSFVERKSASGHSHQRPKRRLRQLWASAPAPLRACAHHHSSWLTLRLSFNLPQPGVSIIRAAPHAAGTDDAASWKANAYAVRSELDLFNDFTYFLSNPVLGDQFHQHDARVMTGANASRTLNGTFAGLPMQTTFGNTL